MDFYLSQGLKQQPSSTRSYKIVFDPFQGIGYVGTAVSVPFIPVLLGIIGRKATMMAGGLCYVTYILCFLHPVPELLYTCAFIGGVGGGLVWIAQGPELVVNSTEKTMNRNSAIFWE